MPILAAYAALCLANLVAAGTGWHALDWATKPLLMPLLALWLWRSARRAGVPAGSVVAALLFSAAGDIALISSGTAWFITGMVLFLGAHLSYIATFVRHGALPRLRVPPLVAVPVALALFSGAALAWLWPGLTEAGLAVPMAAYGVALTATAATSAAYGWRCGLGGLLFLISDLLIAVDVADAAELPGPPVWVMVTYLAGQTLLAAGWLRSQRNTGPITGSR